MHDLIIKKIDELIGSSKLKNIIVAVSGGSDSMALTHILNQYANNNNIKLTAVIVNHNIRVEAGAEAKQVSNWLNDFGIDNVILTNDQQIPETGLIEYARDIRYELLWNFAKQNDCNHIFVAHHYDDILETVAIRLEKASKVFGLAGINAYGKNENGYIVRPMLNVTKADILEYCQNNNIPYVNDPSNENTEFSRVRLRQKIADDNEFKNMLIATHKENLTNRQTIEKTVIQNLKKYTTQLPSGIVKIDMDILKLAKQDLYYTIRQIILWVSGDFSPPRTEKLTQIVDGILADDFTGLTLHGCIIKKLQNSFWIYGENIKKQLGRYELTDAEKNTYKIAPIGDSGNLGDIQIDLPKAILTGVIGVFDDKTLIYSPNQMGENPHNIRVCDNKWDLFYPSPFIY